MDTINMLEAKTHLSRLVDAVESGRETEIVIARHGRPVARLVAMEARACGIRLGVAKGLFKVPDDIDAHNDEVAALLQGGKV
jgi:prevent-host-death family protein